MAVIRKNGMTMITSKNISVLINDIVVSNLPTSVDINVEILSFEEPTIDSDEKIEYYVVHEYDGKVEIINDVAYDKTRHMLAFPAKLFSDYVIGYKIVSKINNSGGSSSGSSEESKPEVVIPEKKAVINTAAK